MNLAIEAQNLGRIYKLRGTKKQEARTLTALENINLTVRQGELFGLLGPNGAGKTTLIKILTTLLAPTSGQALVAGYDVAKQSDLVRPKINMVSGGESSGYGLLTVRENLWMFSQFYGIPSSLANKRIKELLEIVGLSDRINTKSSDLSTGLRQKMNIVRGFMTDPDVLFLDEPTLGLDVGASRDVRRFVRQWISDDPTRTMMLTTHYMVEAEELCDRVAIINKGRVLACDTPLALKRSLQTEAIFDLEISPLKDGDLEALQNVAGVKNVVHAPKDGSAHLRMVMQDESVLSQLIHQLSERSLSIIHLQKREPTLEDVFVALVGQSMAEVEHMNGKTS
jgi:ABC-2 type transport system ATP-binding protein